MRSKRAIVRSACSFTSLFQGLPVGRTNRNGSRKASSIGPCRACVLCSPRSGPFLATFQAPPFLSSVISGPAFTFSVWPSILISRTSTGRERLGNGGNRDRPLKENLPFRVARGHGAKIPIGPDRFRRRDRRAGGCGY